MKLFLIILLVPLTIFADNDKKHYLEMVKELVRYEATFNYNVKNPFFGLVVPEKVSKVVKITKKENNVTKQKRVTEFKLLALMGRKKAYISYSDTNSSGKRWYKKNQLIISNYRVVKIGNGYVKIGDGNLSKIVPFSKQKNKCLKVIK